MKFYIKHDIQNKILRQFKILMLFTLNLDKNNEEKNATKFIFSSFIDNFNEMKPKE